MVEKPAKPEKGFRKLIAWQKAHQLVLIIYKFTDKFPKHELFGLTSQIRRAIVSVPANMAEGYAAGGRGQFGRYLDISQAALAEVEYYLILALELKYINQAEYEQAESLRSETGFLLQRLMETIRKRPS
jgi:four helix bundle protein